MPSPVGHALGGLIAGWTVAGAPALTRADWRRDLTIAARQAAPFALLAAAPDLDLLVGLHSRWSHSLGAACLVTLIVAVATAATPAAGSAAAAALAGPAGSDGSAGPTTRSPHAPRAPRAARAGRLRFALACGLAYATHVLLDWLGSDSSPPLGIMALWPWSSDFYLSGTHWFLATDRRYWLPGFVSRNLYALLWELITLLPLLGLTWWLRRPRTPDERTRTPKKGR